MKFHPLLLKLRFLLLLSLSGMLGCGGGEDLPTLHEVSGTATHNGQALKGVRLTFTPEGDGLPSTGLTDENGKFTLSYNVKAEGVVEGKHTVSVTYVPSTPEEESRQSQPGYKPPAPYDVVVEKYGDPKTSPKKVEITESTDELELKFD